MSKEFGYSNRMTTNVKETIERRCTKLGIVLNSQLCRPVSEFYENTPIFEINSITNLIALCPNHHWEYDNGILKI